MPAAAGLEWPVMRETPRSQSSSMASWSSRFVVFHTFANPFVALYFLSFFWMLLSYSVVVFVVPLHFDRAFPLLE